MLLDRVEDPETGYINEIFQVNISPQSYEEAFVKIFYSFLDIFKQRVAQIVGQGLFKKMPSYKQTKPTLQDPLQMSLIGFGGLN